MNLLRKIKQFRLKKIASSPLIIEHMEVDFVFSRLYDKKHLRIVDIGAHHGEFCDILERHNDEHSYEMICVEPMPENIEVLKAKIGKYRRVKVNLCECAISDMSGTRTFFTADSSTLFTTTPEWKTNFSNNFKNSHDVEVECFTVKDLFSSKLIKAFPPFDFIKIDAEGHDLNIIHSLADAKIRPFALMFEIDPRLEQTIAGIEFLNQEGYSELYVFGRTGIPTTYIGEYESQQKLEQLFLSGRFNTGNIVAF